MSQQQHGDPRAPRRTVARRLVDTGDSTQTAAASPGCASTCRTKTPSASPTATAWRHRHRRRDRLPQGHGKLATVAAVPAPGRFGALKIKERRRASAPLSKSPLGDGGFINGGFFVLSPKVLDYIDRGRPDGFEGPVLASSSPKTTRRLPAHRLLATDGHPARQDHPRRTLAGAARRHGKPGDPAFWRGRRVFVTGPHRLQGRLAQPVAAEHGRRLGLRPRSRRRPGPLSMVRRRAAACTPPSATCGLPWR